MKIVHAADLHVDSPLRGLARLEDAPLDKIRTATRAALARLVDLCLEERAALLLLAGDVFDGDWKDFNTGVFFVRQLARLQETGTEVVVVKGNHDAATVLTRSLHLPSNVRVIGHEKPETLVLERLGVAVHGQSFAQKAVRENLAQRYPRPVAGALNVGLLHTNATGSSEHEPYAPCTVDQLVRHGYDYWALGHVHARSVLHERDPWVVYPGNLQGRHARETGPKGATLLTVEDGRVARVEARTLDVVRWAALTLAAEGAATLEDLLALATQAFAAAAAEAEERPVVARVVVTGATALHARLAGDLEAIRAELQARAAEQGTIWLEKTRIATTPGGGSSRDLPGLERVLRDLVDGLGRDDAPLREVRTELEQFARRLAQSTLSLESEDVRRFVDEAHALVRERLAGPGRPAP